MLKPTDIFSFEESIPISLIRQYCFCPRIPFFYLVYGMTPELKPWVEEGLTFHERMSVLQKRRNLSSVRFDEGRFVPHVDVKSELLKFHGRVDGVFFSNAGDIYPIEFKLAEKEEIRRAHVLQLSAYALALEEKYGKTIQQGFLVLGKKSKVFGIRIDDQKREDVKECLEHIKASLVTGLLPESSASERQCCQCEYLNFCADRF